MRVFRDFTLSPLHAHRNLHVALIHGASHSAGLRLVTLQKAIERGTLVVRETGAVSRLLVENLSPTEDVFIQSGDIVKGGWQDRAIAFDGVVPACSAPLLVDAVCVEQRRWHGRADERRDLFSGSTDQLPTTSARLAASHTRCQDDVWAEVARTQARLTRSLGASVRSDLSATSLQLTMESESVRASAEAYASAIEAAVEWRNDAIGYVACIDGEPDRADLYFSHGLFRALWPKLLRACAVDAASRRAGRSVASPPSPSRIAEFAGAAQSGEVSVRKISSGVLVRVCESERVVIQETYDLRMPRQWLHRSCLAKAFADRHPR
jgi:hypothetical protein